MHEGAWAGQKAILYCAYDNHEQSPQSPDGVHDSQGRVIVTETCPEHLEVMRERVIIAGLEILTLRKK